MSCCAPSNIQACPNIQYDPPRQVHVLLESLNEIHDQPNRLQEWIPRQADRMKNDDTPS